MAEVSLYPPWYYLLFLWLRTSNNHLSLKSQSLLSLILCCTQQYIIPLQTHLTTFRLVFVFHVIVVLFFWTFTSSSHLSLLIWNTLNGKDNYMDNTLFHWLNIVQFVTPTMSILNFVFFSSIEISYFFVLLVTFSILIHF